MIELEATNLKNINIILTLIDNMNAIKNWLKKIRDRALGLEKMEQFFEQLVNEKNQYFFAK